MLRTLAAATALSFAASGALAATVGFNITISGSTNVPTFTLENTSTNANLLTFGITIGDTAFNYDFADRLTAPTGGSIGFTQGHGSNGGARFDALGFTFGDFNAGETASWRVDIDEDNRNSREDYRQVLFNNGEADNAVFTATFDSGNELSLTLADDNDGLDGSYTFGASARENRPLAPVPLPAGFPLMLGGIAALAMVRRRTR